MAEQTILHATLRQATGKGAARSLRRLAQVPAVIYGPDRESEALTIDGTSLNRYFAATDRSAVLDLIVGDREPVKAILRDVQRNPIRPADILHVDLFEIHAGQRITLEVPIRMVGIPDGVRNFGGVLDHQLRELEIEVFPKDIPEHIDVDVTALVIGQGISVRDLQLVDIEILTDPAQLICTVIPPRLEEETTTDEEEAVDAAAEPELIRKEKGDEEDAAETEG